MIKTFKSKALEAFFKEGNTKGVPGNLMNRARVRLEAIDSAAVVGDIRISSYGLHELKGNREGTWSVKVSGNWRITFRFQDGNAYDVDIEDYH
ncbi:MAG: Killer protein [Cyanothece sp. SIO2G6]|nr:Killer protein [Cyanothece sp. SIO2G6]